MRTTARGQHTCRRLLLLAALFCGPGVGAYAADSFKIGGTGAALGTMRLLGAEFARKHPALRVEILPYIGSTGAIKSVDTGAISVGLSGRPAKPDEANLDVRLSRYAITPLVIAVHPAVAATGLSRAQLATIYAGSQTRWDDGGPIRLILRPTKETDNDVLKAISKDMGAALDSALQRKGIHVAATDQDAADALETTPGSLGTTTLSLLVSEKRKLKVLALDGVMPSTKTLADGSYPHRKPLYLVVPKTPSTTVKAFVDFVRSPRGQALLVENAQLPVND